MRKKSSSLFRHTRSRSISHIHGKINALRVETAFYLNKYDMKFFFLTPRTRSGEKMRIRERGKISLNSRLNMILVRKLTTHTLNIEPQSWVELFFHILTKGIGLGEREEKINTIFWGGWMKKIKLKAWTTIVMGLRFRLMFALSLSCSTFFYIFLCVWFSRNKWLKTVKKNSAINLISFFDDYLFSLRHRLSIFICEK